MKVITAEVYGFCNGVKGALAKADEAIALAARLSLPCYLYGSIVHNREVSRSFEAKGVRTILSPEGVEKGVVIIRTHGISDDLRKAFIDNGFIVADATCPVVLRNAEKARSASGPVLIIGKKGHSEIITLEGARKDAAVIESPDDLGSLEAGSYSAVIQTTLSLSLLQEIREEARRIGLEINELNTICGASESRRRALAAIIDEADAFVTVGDSSSANSKELRDMAASYGKPSYLVLSPEDLSSSIFSFGCVGLTAGASTPSSLFESVKKRLEEGR